MKQYIVDVRTSVQVLVTAESTEMAVEIAESVVGCEIDQPDERFPKGTRAEHYQELYGNEVMDIEEEVSE
jgi:hypothetical protein